MILSIVTSSINAQDCHTRLQNSFDSRGAFSVLDDMHQNVFISFFEDGISRCVAGKAFVENSVIKNVFLQYDDNTFELMDSKFYNSERKPPSIINGISEMIYTTEGEKFKVIFIDVLKPKQQ
tara:strand:+ start:108 stop:473 length:366 start_codon:yes stop_codon:yes gene_type:complete